MARKYGKPPLLEALCEFRFAPTGSWDWTIPGLFFERVRGDFPVKEQKNVLELAVEQRPEGLKQDIKGGIARMQFVREDRTALVQVGPDVLAVNQLPPYPGWDGFRSMAIQQLENYLSVAPVGRLARIGLRYINRIDIAPRDGEQSIELNDYFRVVPVLPEPIPQVFGLFLVSVDVVHEAPSMNLRLVFTRSERTIAHYMLDLDMSTLLPEGIPNKEGVPAWLDEAHSRLERAFDTALTEKTHTEVLEERK